jgi:hypothetical protein
MVKKIFIKLLDILKEFKLFVLPLSKQKNMKKYLLTIFGSFEEKDCMTIANNLQPIVDSQNLKFQYRDNVIIVHFGSEFLLDDIHEFIKMTDEVEETFDMFILSEFNDTVSVHMTDGTDEQLFNLDEEDENIDMVKVTPKGKFENYYDEDNENDIALMLLNEIKKNLNTPSLDQLLDKMVEQGVDSLTPYEKAILDNYSQK